MQSVIMPKKNKRKGVFEGLSNSALAFVILVITVSIGALILDQFQNVTAATSGNTSDAFNIIGQGLTGLTTYGNFFSLIVVAIVGVALFILILAGLARFRQGGTAGF